MEWVKLLPPDRLWIFALVLARVSGLMTSAPLFSSVHVPVRFRVLMAIALAGLIFPTQWNAPIPETEDLAALVVLIGTEWFIGLALGLAVAIVFAGIQMAGEVMSRTGGLMLADLFDPQTGHENTILSQFLGVIASTLFFVTGTHRLLVDALLRTFSELPLGATCIQTDFHTTLVTLVTQSFIFAVRVAAPTVVILLAATLILGFAARTLPQLNILAVGLGFNVIILIAGLMLTIAAIAWIFCEELDVWPEVMLEAFARNSPLP